MAPWGTPQGKDTCLYIMPHEVARFGETTVTLAMPGVGFLVFLVPSWPLLRPRVLSGTDCWLLLSSGCGTLSQGRLERVWVSPTEQCLNTFDE